jgi:uncharacterized caspase-like protein
VFSATDDKTLAQERPELEHGVFTHALVSGINGEADLLTGWGRRRLWRLSQTFRAWVKGLVGAQGFEPRTR